MFEKAGYKGVANNFYDNFLVIKADEETHVDFLATAIAAAGCPDGPVLEAKYLFPSTTVDSFLALDSVLEGVGVSAYLGAAADIMDKDYLTAAGSILTIESRHSAYIRSNIKETPFPAPFDTPLDFNEVFTMAGAFITGFDPEDKASAALSKKLKAFPALMVAPQKDVYTSSSTVKFVGGIGNIIIANSPAAVITRDTTIYAAFFSGIEGPYLSKAMPTGNGNFEVVGVPPKAMGQVYVALTTEKNATLVGDANIVAGPTVLEVGPETPSK